MIFVRKKQREKLKRRETVTYVQNYIDHRTIYLWSLCTRQHRGTKTEVQNEITFMSAMFSFSLPLVNDLPPPQPLAKSDRLVKLLWQNAQKHQNVYKCIVGYHNRYQKECPWKCLCTHFIEVFVWDLKN